MTTNYRRSRRKLIYQYWDNVSWWMTRTGFKDGFYAGLMVSVFSVMMAAYLVWGLV